MTDQRYLERAFDLAHNYLRTHPNPRVGAVVVDSTGEVVGEGWHEGPGSAHAEVVALAQAGQGAKGGTVYVSLEPCNHQGRTGPCTEALLEAGVKRVVVGTTDPDRQVRGGGLEHLMSNGIDVVLGDDSDLAREVDPGYFRQRETGLPTVLVKWAMTVDGSVAAADGTSQWITGESARRFAHEMRARSDGVIVGSGTLIADDPRLDHRNTSLDYPQPTPIVISGSRELPETGRIWQRDPVVVSTRERSLPAGELLVVDGEGGMPDPLATCRALADVGLIDLLLEGGPTLTSSWWRAGVITKGVVFIGSKIGGGAGRPPMAGVFETLDEAEGVEFETVRCVGDDVLMTFRKR